MRHKYFRIIMICFLCLGGLLSCEKQVVNNGNAAIDTIVFSPIVQYTNRQMRYCNIENTNYIEYAMINHNNELNYFNDNIPPIKQKNDAMARSVTTDGEKLYVYTRVLTVEEEIITNKTYIYKIDMSNYQLTILYEWDTPRTGRTNFSINIYGDYLYFFKDNVNGSNDICRIKTDGSDFKQLTENNGSIYTGVFVINNTIYYQQDRIIYKANLNSIDQREIFFVDAYTIDLYNGFFYIVRNTDRTMIQIKPENNETKELFENVYEGCYLIKDNMIYYTKNEQKNIGMNTDGQMVANITQGRIYVYDIERETHKLFYENNSIDIRQILNVNATHIFTQCYTNDELLNGTTKSEYYILTINKEEAVYLISDQRYKIGDIYE